MTPADLSALEADPDSVVCLTHEQVRGLVRDARLGVAVREAIGDLTSPECDALASDNRRVDRDASADVWSAIGAALRSES